jgi:hypothetical protein
LRQARQPAATTGPNDATGINRLAAYCQMLGMDAEEAREGLTSMLGFA